LELTHKIRGTSISFGISIFASKSEYLRESIQENSFESALMQLKDLKAILIGLHKEANKMA